MDTLKSFNRCGAKGVYRQMYCQGILYILLKQTIEAPKKRNRTVRMTNIKKKKRKRTIVSKIERKLQFPYVFRHSMSIAQQLMPIYNTTVYKNKVNVAFNLMWLTVGCL